MYRGLIPFTPIKRVAAKHPTGQSRYGLKNTVHSVQIRGMSGDEDLEYLGPPRPGQSWSQYEASMSLPVAVGLSAALVGAMVAGPMGAAVGGLSAWLMSGPATQKTKPLTQGG